MEAQLELKVNGAEGQFYHLVDGERKSVMEIMITETGRLVIKHTEVAAELAGKGYGKSLVNTAVDYARKNGYKVLSVCPYAKNILMRNPENFKDILA